MKRLLLNEERPWRVWGLRIASLLAVIGLVAAAGKILPPAAVVFIAVPVGFFVSWMWKDMLFAPFQWARAKIEGAEGDHRHEWYNYRGQRVRVFFDELHAPWFAAKDICGILGLGRRDDPFRHFGAKEYAVPESAGEPCLSEAGLRRLIKYSKHPDAVGLGPWLDREVLQMIARRRERLGEDA